MQLARVAHVVALLAVLGSWGSLSEGSEPRMSDERVVFQTSYGDIEWGFYPDIAPRTCKHIFALVVLGGYTGNHFFRVDRGFVAQTQSVGSGRGRDFPLNAAQILEENKKVPLEVVPEVKHEAGVLSMARWDDPNSGGSSFSILLGKAPHLDMKYTVFGKITKGWEVLRKMEGVETRREGIFVMPKERISILGSYWHYATRAIVLGGPQAAGAHPVAATVIGAGATAWATGDTAALQECKLQLTQKDEELQRVRRKCLPGR